MAVTINSLGFTYMSASKAAGTPYGGGSDTFSASKAVTPGPHALFLSIFDASDMKLDSAVFVDDIHTHAVVDPASNCASGIQPNPTQPPKPQYSFSASLVDKSCNSATYQFSDTSTPASPFVSWAWDFGDGGTASGSSVSHTYTTEGAKVVTLVASDGSGGSFTVTQQVIVSFVSCPPTIDAIAPGTVLPGDDVEVCAVGHPGLGGALSYTVERLPEGASFTGPCFSWIPTDSQRGTYPCISITVHEAGSTLTATTCLSIRVAAPSTEPAPDADLDGIPDSADNCSATSNHDQADTDRDGVGDACDPECGPDPACPATRIADGARGRRTFAPDGDQDGTPDTTDDCPTVANPDQSDRDRDQIGDACDADIDGDGIADVGDAGAFLDNCPLKPNADQKDADGDGVGDACQPAAAGPASATTGRMASQAPVRSTFEDLGMTLVIAAGVAAALTAGLIAMALRRGRHG
ncbi:MAG: thrombospondin type 3 repeat-containing protein [bacterium]